MHTLYNFKPTRNSVFLIWAFILSACAPTYKTVDIFTPPTGDQAQWCLGNCEDYNRSCTSTCSQQFQECSLRAQIQAQDAFQRSNQIYQTKIAAYTNALANYNFQYQQYEKLRWHLKHSLQEATESCDKQDNDRHDYACRQKEMLSNQLQDLQVDYFSSHGVLYQKPAPPEEPASLDKQFKDIRDRICVKDCGCDGQFKACYVSCGGSVGVQRVCVSNCGKDNRPIYFWDKKSLP